MHKNAVFEKYSVPEQHMLHQILEGNNVSSNFSICYQIPPNLSGWTNKIGNVYDKCRDRLGEMMGTLSHSLSHILSPIFR